MLDIARHFQTPSAVMQLIDQASAYKVNTLHLHVSDDQGFRIVINGFPNLTKIGSQGSVGTGGRTMDPGGYWSQADYRAVVADAAAHFMRSYLRSIRLATTTRSSCPSTTTRRTRG